MQTTRGAQTTSHFGLSSPLNYSYEDMFYFEDILDRDIVLGKVKLQTSQNDCSLLTVHWKTTYFVAFSPISTLDNPIPTKSPGEFKIEI